MGQQVSVDVALPIFRQRCGELHDENLILRARVVELEQQLAAQANAQPPAAVEPEPVPSSPYQVDERL